jgi:5-(hydroxymethyl)furfural/furfural oxidase
MVDTLIIGAGTAGSVLAHRLSADREHRVIVIEAGADLEPGREPADIRSIFPLSTFNPAYAWPDTRVHWRDARSSPPSPMPQGRVLGGTSAIMGMWAMRGKPQVYDAWAAAGAEGWDWAGVLPYFRRLEDDRDCEGPLHGRGGPVPIRREPCAAWSPLALAFQAAALDSGFAHVADMNAVFGDGHCALPISRFDGHRGSAGICYLDAATRARPNLQVMTHCQVTGLLLADPAPGEPPRVIGVQLLDAQGQRLSMKARRVIVAAGALRTPELLLRSGIGPVEDLRAAGIRVLHPLRGVGANLQNHPLLFMVSYLAPGAVEKPGVRPAGFNYLRWSSGLDGVPTGDMGMSIRSWLSWHALGRRMGAIAPTISMPLSRGRVLLDAGPEGLRPRIEFNMLSDPRDLSRMMKGMRLAASLHAQLSSVCGPAFVLKGVANISRLMRYNAPTRMNGFRAALAAACVDMAPKLGRRWVSRFAQMTPVEMVLASDDALAEFALSSVSGTGHICGTCRMGSPADPDAVVDSKGKVIGMSGLYIADASVMPLVPSGGTHLPTIMVAEKLAASLQSPSRAISPGRPAAPDAPGAA